jgi:two-component system osmolarity sensor histidine kinase EnvZ
MSFAWLKHYMPRSLYGRAALILLLPVVFMQLVVSVVFTQRHFEDVTLQMTRVAEREVALILEGIAMGDLDRLSALQIAVRPVDPSDLQRPDARLWYDFSGTIITRRFRETVPGVAAVDLSNDRMVHLLVETPQGPFDLVFDRRRVSASNPHQLFVNMVFFSVLITVVALIYLRNQLRPIKRLATASAAFGRGRHVPYSPAGSTEVRAAGAA